MRKPLIAVLMFLLVFGAISFCSGRDNAGPVFSLQGLSRYLEKGTIKMRIFEGSGDLQAPPEKTVTSSFLPYNLPATVESDEDPQTQSLRIRNAFNLESVAFLTEALLVWEKGKPEPGSLTFRIGDKTYHVIVAPTDIIQRKLKIDVFEQTDGTRISLLSTEAGLPRNISTVFGFKDVQGKPCFVSLQIGEWSTAAGGGTVTPPVSPAPPVPDEGPVRATGEINPPKLLKIVEPDYPDAAQKAGVEGIVILEATTDVYGRVQNTKILRSLPLLDQAAEDAVKQWVYEPVVIKGKARGIIFTVTVRFSLKDKTPALSIPAEEAVKTEKADLSDKAFKEGAALPPVRAEEKITPPDLVKRVEPAYPPDAQKAGVEGIVILEATTDVYGRVASVKVLRSVSGLDQAALDAVKQWVYKPLLVEGKPRGCIFTVTVRFSLK